MVYFECVMFWPGVVLWIVCIMAALMVFGESLGLCIPGICRGKTYAIYSFGIGQYAVMRDEDAVNRMRQVGFNIRGGNGRWWMCKILRWQP